MRSSFSAVLSILLLLGLSLGLGLAQNKKGKKPKSYPKKEFYSGKPVRALIVTGGCCHNYLYQTFALGSGVQKVANVDFEIVHVGGRGTQAMIDLYNESDWAEPYEVVIHTNASRTPQSRSISVGSPKRTAAVRRPWSSTARCTPTGLPRSMIGGVSRGYESKA